MLLNLNNNKLVEYILNKIMTLETLSNLSQDHHQERTLVDLLIEMIQEGEGQQKKLVLELHQLKKLMKE
jgi:hypothetical protein